MDKYIFIILLAFAIAVFGFVYWRARFAAKKYCELYELDFKRFWRDIFLLRNKWEDSEWDRLRYKLKKTNLKKTKNGNN